MAETVSGVVTTDSQGDWATLTGEATDRVLVMCGVMLLGWAVVIVAGLLVVRALARRARQHERRATPEPGSAVSVAA